MKNYRIDIESHKSRCNKTESVRTLIKPTVQTAVIYALYKKDSYDNALYNVHFLFDKCAEFG